MTLLTMIVILAIFGVALYLLFTLVPMDPRIKTAIGALVGLFLFLWILQSFGVIHTGLRLY